MRVLKGVCNIQEFHHVQLQALPTYGKALLMRMNDMCLHKPPLIDNDMLHWLPLACIPAHMGHIKYLQDGSHLLKHQLATEKKKLETLTLQDGKCLDQYQPSTERRNLTHLLVFYLMMNFPPILSQCLHEDLHVAAYPNCKEKILN